MLGCLKFILTRAFVLYAACFFLIWHILDFNKLVTNAVPTTMSRLTPPIDYFSEFVDRDGQYDRYKLMECVYYHRAVAYFFDIQQADAYGMLGFCYDRLGQQAQAVDSFKKAITVFPEFFWPYYNLGVISYRQAHYAEAENYFYQALEQDSVKTVLFLSRSKVYNDVNLSKGAGSSDDYIKGLTQGRQDAYVMLMDSQTRTGSYVQLWNTALNGLKEGLDMDGVFYYYAGVAAYKLKSYPMAQAFIAKAAQMHRQGIDLIEAHLKARVRFF